MPILQHDIMLMDCTSCTYKLLSKMAFTVALLHHAALICLVFTCLHARHGHALNKWQCRSRNMLQTAHCKCTRWSAVPYAYMFNEGEGFLVFAVGVVHCLLWKHRLGRNNVCHLGLLCQASQDSMDRPACTGYSSYLARHSQDSG